eukprot:scaffold8005_cov118-Isochrysis_galbana.AAC.3
MNCGRVSAQAASLDCCVAEAKVYELSISLISRACSASIAGSRCAKRARKAWSSCRPTRQAPARYDGSHSTPTITRSSSNRAMPTPASSTNASAGLPLRSCIVARRFPSEAGFRTGCCAYLATAHDRRVRPCFVTTKQPKNAAVSAAMTWRAF